MIARDKRGSVVLAKPINSPMVDYPEVILEATVQKRGSRRSLAMSSNRTCGGWARFLSSRLCS